MIPAARREERDIAKIRLVDPDLEPPSATTKPLNAVNPDATQDGPHLDAALDTPASARWRFGGFDEQSAVFAVPWRAAAVALAGVLVIAATVVAPFATTPVTYLLAMVGVGCVPAIAAQQASLVASRRCHPVDRTFWRWWFAANISLGIAGLLLLAAAPGVAGDLRHVAPIGVAISGIVFLRAHGEAIRRRSGDLSLGLDIVQGLIAAALIGCVVFTALGHRLLDSPSSWYTLPTAMNFSGTIIGLGWSVQLFNRTAHEARRIEAVVLVMSVLSVLNAFGQLAMGVSDFALPVAPLLALHGVNMAALLLVPLHASRRRAAGLERLAPQEQVRSSRALTVFVLVTIPVLVVEVAIVRDDVPWAVANFAVVMAVVAALAAVRSLLVIRETTRLYEAVANASLERQRLVVALLRSIDDDRHRFARQLHQQATASYATFATLVQSAARTGGGTDELSETSAELRAELGRNADALRDLVRAVTPIEHELGSARSMTTAIRAFVDSLYGNRARPSLAVEVADDLHLDWATEAVIVRILQEAIANVWQHAHASAIAVRVAPTGGGVEVLVADDGRGFEPEALEHLGGLAAVRTFVELGGGLLHLDSAPGRGTNLRAVVGPLRATPRSEAQGLHVVIDLTDDH